MYSLLACKGLCLKNKFDYSVINSFSNKIAFPSPDFQTVSVLISAEFKLQMQRNSY